jgi:hypothetical protein
MKKLLIMALLFATQTNAQQITWQKYYNISTGINFCMSLLQLEDSGFIVASSWPQNPFIGRIFKTNKYGDTIQSVKHHKNHDSLGAVQWTGYFSGTMQWTYFSGNPYYTLCQWRYIGSRHVCRL